MEHSQSKLVLPVSIVSPTDIARLTREIESIDNFFRESAIRQPGDNVAMPRMSKLMDQFVNDNQLNLLEDSDRSKVLNVLTKLHQSAPTMHMSFSVDPPGPYVQKIVTWLRKNIHPQVLVTVGLQPNIGAGCVVRTTNKLFDFSLREYFTEQRQFFIDKLHNALSEPVPGEEELIQEQVQQSEVQPEAQVVEQPVVNEVSETEAPEASEAQPVPLAQAAPQVNNQAEEETEQQAEVVTEDNQPAPAPLPIDPATDDSEVQQ